MRYYTKVFSVLILSTLISCANGHRFRYHIPIEKDKEVAEEVHPLLFRRPYSITKELWFPFGSFGYKRHVAVKRDTEEEIAPAQVQEFEVKGGDLDELTKVPSPVLGAIKVPTPALGPIKVPTPTFGPVLAEPLPPDTPVIRPMDSPPVPVIPEKVELLPPAKPEEPKNELNTDIKPFINPVPPPPIRQIEENFIFSPLPPAAEPPKEPVPPEAFGTYMRKGRELILDFGRYLFTRMSELLNRARNFRLVSSRTVAN